MMQKILIVDDSSSIRKRFIAILSSLAECHTATNGKEAVDLLKACQPPKDCFDIIIMDIIMPIKDGLTAVKEIREYERNMGCSVDEPLTIVIVTTINDPSRILMAQYECGADAYITKPFTAETVLQTLSNNGLDITGHDEIVSNHSLWSYS